MTQTVFGIFLGLFLGLNTVMFAPAVAKAQPVPEEQNFSELTQRLLPTDTLQLTSEPGDPVRPFRGYIPLELNRGRTVKHAEQSSNVIYLNGCFGSGCRLTPGFEDSIANRSSIIGTQSRQISPYEGSQADWDAIVACVRETYSAFNVVIVEEDPSPKPHFEAIVAGTPAEAGFPPSVAGVAPFDRQNCGVIDNVITFSFANVFPTDINTICWTAAQEIAHGFGLDHEFLCEDPMTYLSSCGSSKRFVNKDARCGEFEERDCECNRSHQNSVRAIMDVFGPRFPTPPQITILEPEPGAKVAPGALIKLKIEDDVGVERVELRINGTTISTLTEEPFLFRLPLTAAEGPLTVEIFAADLFGASSLSQLRLTQATECSKSSSCEKGFACVAGRCAPGPGTDGGLGAACEQDRECGSSLCTTTLKETEEAVCTEPCLLGQKSGCPEGFTCEAASDDEGVCWPSKGGGCQTGPSQHWSYGIFVLLAIGLLFRRRRTPSRA